MCSDEVNRPPQNAIILLLLARLFKPITNLKIKIFNIFFKYIVRVKYIGLHWFS